MITLKSKTINWTLIKAMAGSALLAIPQFREFLPLEAYGVILAVFTAADIYLRSITTQPLSEK